MSENNTETMPRGRTKRALFGLIVLIIVLPLAFWSLGYGVIRANQIRTGTQTRVITTSDRPVIVTNQVLKSSTHLSQQELRSQEIAGRVRQLRGDAHQQEREELLAELRQILGIEFTERQDRQAKEIEAAQQRLNSVKDMLAKRTELKDAIVQRRINQLIGQPDVLDWNQSPPPALPHAATAVHGQYSLRLGGAAVPRIAQPSPEGHFVPPLQKATAPLGVPIGQYGPPHIATGDPAGTQPHSDHREFSSTYRIETGSGSEVFAIARRVISAHIAAEAAVERLAQMESLHERGAVPQAEIRAERAKSQQTTAERALAEAELKSLQRRLKREAEFAAENVKRAESIKQQAMDRVRSGTGQYDALMQTEAAVSAAKRALLELENSKKELDEALELIETSTAEDEEAESDTDANEDDPAGKPILRDERGDDLESPIEPPNVQRNEPLFDEHGF